MGINNPSAGSSLWTLITDTTLAASGRFDVSGIESVYAFLYGIVFARSDVAAGGDVVNFFINGDTTAGNYRRGSHDAGSVHQVGVGDDAFGFSCPAATAPANTFGFLEFTIPFYAETAYHKNIWDLSGQRQTAATILYSMAYIVYEDTAVLTQITIQPDGYDTDEFVADSRLLLYGVGTA